MLLWSGHIDCIIGISDVCEVANGSRRVKVLFWYRGYIFNSVKPQGVMKPMHGPVTVPINDPVGYWVEIEDKKIGLNALSQLGSWVTNNINEFPCFVRSVRESLWCDQIYGMLFVGNVRHFCWELMFRRSACHFPSKYHVGEMEIIGWECKHTIHEIQAFYYATYRVLIGSPDAGDVPWALHPLGNRVFCGSLSFSFLGLFCLAMMLLAIEVTYFHLRQSSLFGQFSICVVRGDWVTQATIIIVGVLPGWFVHTVVTTKRSILRFNPGSLGQCADWFNYG